MSSKIILYVSTSSTLIFVCTLRRYVARKRYRYILFCIHIIHIPFKLCTFITVHIYTLQTNLFAELFSIYHILLELNCTPHIHRLGLGINMYEKRKRETEKKERESAKCTSIYRYLLLCIRKYYVRNMR